MNTSDRREGIPEKEGVNITSEQELIQQLLENTKVTKHIWDIISKKGTSIQVDKSAWVSSASKNHKRITFGLRPFPRQEAKRWGFSEQISEAELQTYKLSHAMIHMMIFDIFENQAEYPEWQQQMRIVGAAREKTSFGFSRHANSAFYKSLGWIQQRDEDITELVNMYAVNPKLLTNYLGWLADPTKKETLRIQGLVQIHSQMADLIFDLIGHTFKRYIEGNFRE